VRSARKASKANRTDAEAVPAKLFAVQVWEDCPVMNANLETFSAELRRLVLDRPLREGVNGR